jgi:DNA-binding GntR family transcriptional regulator
MVTIDITNINEKIYNLIKTRIARLEYPPGYQINIKKLQDELGISSSPIKDALFMLVGESLLEIIPRKGTFVKDVSEIDIIENEQFRTILEVGAVDIIADTITNEQISLLERRHRELSDELVYDAFMEKDNQFHLDIIGMTKNEKLIRAYKHLNSHVNIIRCKFSRNEHRPYSWTLQDHLEILDALRNRDSENAKKAIRSHRIKSRDALLQKRDENKNE